MQYYTHHEVLDSSAVKAAYYDEASSKMAVEMHSSTGDVYVYHNVPLHRFLTFVGARSAGQAFQNIKADFGPSHEAVPVEILLKRELVGVGTPKALTYAPGANVTYVQSGGGQRFALSSDGSASILAGNAAPAEVLNYSVYFIIDDSDDTKEHEVKASSVDEAIAITEKPLNMLGLQYTISHVTVWF